MIGGGSDAGPNGGLTGPGFGDHNGYSDQVYLTISDHWYSGISEGNYAWHNAGNILGYNGQHQPGTISGTFRSADFTTADADLGLYFITLATYQWTITVTASEESGLGTTGGTGTGDWYREHLSVTVSGNIIETTNLQIAEDFKATGSIANHSGYTIAGHIVSASPTGPGSGASYTYHVTKESAGNLNRVEVGLNENLETTINRTTSLDSLLDRDGYTDMNLTISGSVQVMATSKYSRTTDFESNKTGTGRNFNVVVSESSEVDFTLTFINASLIKQTIGYTPVALPKTLAGQRRPMQDDNGNDIPRPSEGRRFSWEMNGTKSWEDKSTHVYQGNGGFAFVADNWIRVGEITSKYNAESSYANDYTSTVQRDETMHDVTKLYWIDIFGGEGYNWVKIAAPDPPYQYVILHSRSETTDKSRGETKTKYTLKRSYRDDGKVATTTESVVEDGITQPSFVTESHTPDLRTEIVSSELAVSQSPGHDQTNFNYTSEIIDLSGTWNRKTSYNTTNETGQIGDTAKVFSGTVKKVGAKNITIEYDAESIDSRAGWKYEFHVDGVQAVAMEIGSNTVGDATPTGDSTLTNKLSSTVGTTDVVAATYDFEYIYDPDESVIVKDKSTITSHTTRLSTVDVEEETVERNTSKDGTTIHYKSESNNKTTVTGKPVGGDDSIQDVWNEPGLQSVKNATVGEASRVITDTTTIYTPIPGSENDTDVTAATAGESASGRKYDVDVAGTVTLIELSKIETIIEADGSKLTNTTQIGNGQDGAAPFETVEFLHVTWLHTTSIDAFNSTTNTETHQQNSQSFRVDVNGTKHKNAKVDGVSTMLKVDSVKTGAATNFSSWEQRRDALLNGNPEDFPSDFLVSISKEDRLTTEDTFDNALHQFDYTAYYEMGLVPANSTDDESDSGQASATAPEAGSENGGMVPGIVEVSRTGRVTETARSSNKSWDEGYDFQYRLSRTSTGTYRASNLPGSGYVEFAYSFARNDLAPGQQNLTLTMNAKKTTTDYGTLVDGTHVRDGVVTTKIEGIDMDGMEGAGMKTLSKKLQTRQNELMVKKWEDNLGAGSGQLTFSHLVSLPIEGPNYSETESTTVTFSNFEIKRSPVATNGGDSGNQNGQSNNNGSSSQSGESGNTGQSSNPSGPSVESQFDKIRDNLAQRSAPEPGVDVTGETITASTSSFMFAERWTRDIAKVYAYPLGTEYHMAASVESSHAERTTKNNKSYTESVVFLPGASYTLNKLDDQDKTEIKWIDHVHNRHFHSQTFISPVTPPSNVPTLPAANTGGADPATLLPPSSPVEDLRHEYISHMNYDSPSNTIEGETKSEIVEPFTYNPETNDKILYLYTRTLNVDAGADAMIRSKEWRHSEKDPPGTFETIFTSTKTEFSETNYGQATEKRQMHRGATGGFVEGADFNNSGSAMEITQNISIIRRQEFNYIVTPQGSVPLVPQPIYTYTESDPHYFRLSDPEDKALLIKVKEFARIQASNETGSAPSQGSESSYPSDDDSEGAEAGGSDLMTSITKLIQMDMNAENTLAFGKAFAAGFFYDGLGGTATMIWDTAVWGMDALSFAGTYLVSGSDAAFSTDFGQGVVAAGQSLDQALYSAMEFGKTFYAVANDLPVLLGLASGSLSNETQQVLDQVNVILQELLPEILAELAEIPQHEKAAILGQIAGMVTFEIALSVGVSVATAGAGTAISAAAMAGKICKWARKLNSLLPKPIAKRILPLVAKYIGCFEAETNIASYSVHGDLAAVTLAVRADLELRPQTRPFLTDGQWAAIGLGLVVALSCSGLQRKSKSDQESDDDPWQVQYHYAA